MWGRGGKATRAKGKPKLPTERVIRAGDGYRITVERRRGIDVLGLIEAMASATETLRAERPVDEGGAAGEAG